jgi:hypothetical protein
MKTLAADDQDVYEEVLEIVSYLTYFSPCISPAMWQLYPILCKALHDWAMDYFENILIPMDNYISRSTDVRAREGVERAAPCGANLRLPCA